jgi:hypothetical protein
MCVHSEVGYALIDDPSMHKGNGLGPVRGKQEGRLLLLMAKVFAIVEQLNQIDSGNNNCLS